MKSAERRTHWDTVYTTKAADAVSWFQPEPTQSLRLLHRFGLTAQSCVIDVGGGDSHLVDYLIREGCTCVAVLDVSEAALARARERLGPAAGQVEWIVADVTGNWSVAPRDVWHDRAMFHFLTDSGDRARYIDHVREVMKPGGTVVIATFAVDGPEKCSGLPVARYSPETLTEELRPDFTLVEHAPEAHRTPGGGMQSFVYCVFTFAPGS
ncbi:MAG TPA: class I SAM-dependent methyltransferase [Vicinamibacterales bacterium]|nr:class I SAM-dependent methyltransferase [Vicinamibacterales bacterium]